MSTKPSAAAQSGVIRGAFALSLLAAAVTAGVAAAQKGPPPGPPPLDACGCPDHFETPNFDEGCEAAAQNPDEVVCCECKAAGVRSECVVLVPDSVCP